MVGSSALHRLTYKVVLLDVGGPLGATWPKRNFVVPGTDEDRGIFSVLSALWRDDTFLPRGGTLGVDCVHEYSFGALELALAAKPHLVLKGRDYALYLVASKFGRTTLRPVFDGSSSSTLVAEFIPRDIPRMFDDDDGDDVDDILRTNFHATSPGPSVWVKPPVARMNRKLLVGGWYCHGNGGYEDFRMIYSNAALLLAVPPLGEKRTLPADTAFFTAEDQFPSHPMDEYDDDDDDDRT
mmetsp:Transcript_28972/g.93409  ORF Transcript_28972/g.93409 Transcript_28972/m.93409 type:complete len:239 (+) Transcript_28972:878-1594(+)